MNCSKPFVTQHGKFGCGQCLPCRVNYRQVWETRLLFEALHHQMRGCFLTLSYDDDHLPANGTLVKKHFVDFIKRLRYHVGGAKLRYFGVGEYGKKTERPHYHALIFGWPAVPFDATVSRASRLGIVGGAQPAAESPIVETVRNAWSFGFVGVGNLNIKTIRYSVKDLLKGVGRVCDGEEARVPHFRLMSRRPAIGTQFVERMAADFLTHRGAVQLGNAQDVPPFVVFEGKERYLGRVLRRKLREAVGWSPDEPDLARALRQMRNNAEIQELGLEKYTEQEKQKRKGCAVQARIVYESSYYGSKL